MMFWDSCFEILALEQSLSDDFSEKVYHFDDGLDNYSEIVILGCRRKMRRWQNKERAWWVCIFQNGNLSNHASLKLEKGWNEKKTDKKRLTTVSP